MLKLAGPALVVTALVLPALVLAAAAPAAAQPAPAAGYPKIIPAPGGEVILPSAGFERTYEAVKYAPARRAGDFVYVSGVVAGPIGDEGRDAEAFRLQVRRAFSTLKRILAASGAGFGDVVMINSFHVWQGPGFAGTKDEQFAVISAVKDEFMPGPHPAWTAVGTTGLLPPDGVVEIQMIAYAPKAR
jgi:enamine deaminase RidA (YjgF/YER057c/UK114 family)